MCHNPTQDLDPAASVTREQRRGGELHYQRGRDKTGPGRVVDGELTVEKDISSSIPTSSCFFLKSRPMLPTIVSGIE
jgi:hypothetical protein